MRMFIHWTGIYNLAAGLALFFPVLLRNLGIMLPVTVMWTELLGFLIVFLGVVLILCARNLAMRAPIVVWSGLLSLAVGVEMGWFGWVGVMGPLIGLLGVLEVIFGLVYLIALPRALGRRVSELLRDTA